MISFRTIRHIHQQQRVTVFLRRFLQTGDDAAVKTGMQKRQKHTDQSALLSHQRTRCHIRHIAAPPDLIHNAVTGVFTQMTAAVYRIGNSPDRNAHGLCNVFESYHDLPLKPLLFNVEPTFITLYK